MKQKHVSSGILGIILCLSILLTMTGCGDSSSETKEYTVIFNPGEGSGVPPTAQKVKDGKFVILPGQENMVAPANKTFKGWALNGAPFSAYTSYTVTGDVVFIAQWESTTPATPTGAKVHVRHMSSRYQDRFITRVTIVKWDDTKEWGNGEVYKDYNNITIKYGETWDGGLITERGSYKVNITEGVGAEAYHTGSGKLEIYELSGTIILTYDGEKLDRN